MFALEGGASQQIQTRWPAGCAVASGEPSCSPGRLDQMASTKTFKSSFTGAGALMRVGYSPDAVSSELLILPGMSEVTWSACRAGADAARNAGAGAAPAPPQYQVSVISAQSEISHADVSELADLLAASYRQYT